MSLRTLLKNFLLKITIFILPLLAFSFVTKNAHNILCRPIQKIKKESILFLEIENPMENMLTPEHIQALKEILSLFDASFDLDAIMAADQINKIYQKNFYTRIGHQRQSAFPAVVHSREKRQKLIQLLKYLGFLNEWSLKSDVVIQERDSVLIFGGLLLTMKQRIQYVLNIIDPLRLSSKDSLHYSVKNIQFYGLTGDRCLDHDADGISTEEYEFLNNLFPPQLFFPMNEAHLLYYAFCSYTCGFKKNCHICYKNNILEPFHSAEDFYKRAEAHGLHIVYAQGVDYKMPNTEQTLEVLLKYYEKNLSRGNLFFVSTQPFMVHHKQKTFAVMKSFSVPKEMYDRSFFIGPAHEVIDCNYHYNFCIIMDSLAGSVYRCVVQNNQDEWTLDTEKIKVFLGTIINTEKAIETPLESVCATH